MKGSLNFDGDIAKDIVVDEIKDFVPKTYLPYSASTILDRALPGKDGLIPIQRRILWAMNVNRHYPGTAHSKVSSIQGEVMHYHPHGDASIVSSVVRMAQPYSLRVTLMDPKGSYAAVFGDTAAQPRYLSVRLTKAAMDCLEELKYGAVEIGLNYEGNLPEPPLIPMRFPAAIINGSQGIATGFATLMPHHNPTEAMKAARYMLRHPDASIDDIMKIMPGPDWSAGGVILGTNGIRDYYTTGTGSITIRAKNEIEPGTRGRSTLVFRELPPLVSVETIQKKVMEIFDSEAWKDNKDKSKKQKYITYAPARKALSGIERIIDQTDYTTGGVRLEFELKQGSNAAATAIALYKYTALESKFSPNNTVIYNGHPQTVGIRELFKQFLDFRRECVYNVSKNKKAANDKRIEQIKGLLIIILDIDKAIAIIRSSNDDTSAKNKLMKQFKISDEQAEYILSMQLRRLTRQNKTALTTEQKTLEQSNKELNKILTDKKALDDEVDRLLVETSKIIADERHTEILDKTPEQIAQEEKDSRRAIKNADKDVPCTLVIKSTGKLARLKENENITGNILDAFKVNSHSRIIVFGDDGNGYAAPASYITEGADTDIRSPFGINRNVGIVGMAEDGSQVISIASDGQIKITQQLFNDKWNEHSYQSLKAGQKLVKALRVPTLTRKDAHIDVIIITKNGKAIRFDINEIRPTGIGAGGVAGIKLGANDQVVDMMLSTDDNNDSIITLTGITKKRTMISDITKQKRAGSGVTIHKLSAKDEIKNAGINVIPLEARKQVDIKPTKTSITGSPMIKPIRLVFDKKNLQ